MLQEEAEDEGRDVPDPPAEARSWWVLHNLAAAAAGGHLP